MKKIIVAAALALGLLQITTQQVHAQVSVNINIGNQPAWGPVGYDYVQYYYIPEINAYYDVMTGQYIYLQNRRWIHARALPPRYRHVDMYRTYKVVVNQPHAYKYNHQHIRNYHGYKNNRNQMVLRDNRNYNHHQQRPPMHQSHGPRNDNRYRAQAQHPPKGNQHRNDARPGNRANGPKYDNDRNRGGRDYRNDQRLGQQNEQHRNGGRR